MPLYAEVRVDGSGSSTNWVPLDQYQTPFAVSFGVRANGNNIKYTVQHTFDPVLKAGTSAVAFPHANVVATTASLIDGNYAFPVAAVRLTLVCASAGEFAIFQVRQAGT